MAEENKSDQIINDQEMGLVCVHDPCAMRGSFCGKHLLAEPLLLPSLPLARQPEPT